MRSKTLPHVITICDGKADFVQRILQFSKSITNKFIFMMTQTDAGLSKWGGGRVWQKPDILGYFFNFVPKFSKAKYMFDKSKIIQKYITQNLANYFTTVGLFEFFPEQF